MHRVYTQNVDGLEKKAGVPEEKLVQLHGMSEVARCAARCCQAHFADMNKFKPKIAGQQ